MKLSQLVSTTIFGLISCSYAIPLRVRIADIESLLARAYEIDDLVGREWIDIEARTGSFANINAGTKQKANGFIDKALQKSAVHNAATPSKQTGTYHEDKTFHLDRQTPTNEHSGDHKVAVQLNHNPGQPTTIGQAVIHKDAKVSPKTVAAKLKHSVNTGQEVRVPSSKKAERKSANDAKHVAKQQKNAASHAKGMAKAASGKYKKGNK